MTAKRRRSIYLADEQWDALAEAAKAEDRSVNSVIRRLVGSFLMGQMDYTTYVARPDGSHEIVSQPALVQSKR